MYFVSVLQVYELPLAIAYGLCFKVFKTRTKVVLQNVRIRKNSFTIFNCLDSKSMKHIFRLLLTFKVIVHY